VHPLSSRLDSLSWIDGFVEAILDLIYAFIGGLVLGLVIQALDMTLNTILVSVTSGIIVSLVLFLWNIKPVIDDLGGLYKAIMANSFFSIITWICGFIGSLLGSSWIAST
jgi:hypothetical protein